MTTTKPFSPGYFSQLWKGSLRSGSSSLGEVHGKVTTLYSLFICELQTFLEETSHTCCD
ncbi:hypothetical protein RchiOBHm_Chr2g0116511 [Rosa chinensis]|uniref:Uncharacterized protein n=1 Tax=Rosa chinensis TaxID=74649 RepID=A0A2P6RRA2_ROSCH|nr:hypothetical protein RchiOBHm_Chr2g0116511 [Rosa chinensis]